MGTTIEMFKTESCGRCPAVIDRLSELADEQEIDLEIVDVEEDRARALQYGIFSVPSVVVGGETTLTGVPSKAEIVAAIEEHDATGS